jgi:SAM-dependent methyltransferase
VTERINRTMSRRDLFTREGLADCRAIDALLDRLRARGLSTSSWVGTLPAREAELALAARLARPGAHAEVRADVGAGSRTAAPAPRADASDEGIGLDQRLDYEPVPGAAADGRIPWFLYWEIHWVLHVTRPRLRPGMRLLDAGGASSIFSCFLASLGYDVDTVDLNPALMDNGNAIARAMGWKSRAHHMDLRELSFPDECFDHAYSICVFEHIDYPVKQLALAEIARCLKPGGILSLTFDFRNPAPGVKGFGKDRRPQNRLSTQADLQRSFLSCPAFDLLGNPVFHDNGESYLVHRRFDDAPYTFGALFLRRRA